MLLLCKRLVHGLTLCVGLISGFLILVVGGILFVEVACRYAGYPTKWIPETSVYLFAWATLGGGAYTLLRNKHVQVELLLMHLSPRSQAILDRVTSLAGAAFCGLIAWHGWEHLQDVLETGETTPTTLRIPLWLTDFPLPFGFGLLALLFLLKALLPDVLPAAHSDSQTPSPDSGKGEGAGI